MSEAKGRYDWFTIARQVALQVRLPLDWLEASREFKCGLDTLAR